MKQTRIIIIDHIAAIVELMKNNASPLAGEVYSALDIPAGTFLYQTMHGMQEGTTKVNGLEKKAGGYAHRPMHQPTRTSPLGLTTQSAHVFVWQLLSPRVDAR
jgi:hypothetical protein